MKHIVIIETGDHSGDGHEKTDVFVYKCNFSAKKIAKFHEIFKEKYGIDIIKEFEDYEQNTLSFETFNIILENKLENVFFPEELEKQEEPIGPPSSHEEYINDYGGCCPSMYADIYMQIAKHIEPKLQFKEVKNQTIEIGGYGLYY